MSHPPGPAARWHGDALRPGRRRAAQTVLRSTLAASTILVVYFVMPLDRTDGVFWRSAFSLTLLGAVIVWQFRAVARADQPILRAVEALVVAVPLLLVISAGTYLRLSHRDPAAFTEELNHVGALYLAMMTMTTVGFGDIGALSDAARISVMVQMVVNLGVLGVAARIILSMARARRGAAGS